MFTYPEYPLSACNVHSGQCLDIVIDMNKYQLQLLEEAIHIRKNMIIADRLMYYGLNVEIKNPYLDEDEYYYFIAIEDPSNKNRFVNATQEQCKNLLDRLVNLTPREAFKRFEEKYQFTDDYIFERNGK